MPSVTPKVVLLTHTPEPIATIYASFRQCYHAGFVGDMWEKLLSGEIPKEKQAAFISSLIESGHTSPIEHVSFTFAISGVSRALTHQLVRHRLASYSQQSQRYVDGSSFDYVIPPSIANDPPALEKFTKLMEHIAENYKELNSMLALGGRAASSIEDARFILPQAAATRIVVTMNCRVLLNFFEHRCCFRAQWEIREVAHMMLNTCRKVLPAIFDPVGAKCERLKYCPEGEKYTCGLYPVL